MPIYEYEPKDHDCFICRGRFEHLQAVSEEPLTHCPTCGLEVRRVVSKAQIRIAKYQGAERAGQKGLTTFRKVEKGKWEKVGGPGVDMIVGTPEDQAAIDAEKKPAKKLNLDKAD